MAGLVGNAKCRDTSRNILLDGLRTSIKTLHDRLAEKKTAIYEKNMVISSKTSPTGSARNYQGCVCGRWIGELNANIKGELRKDINNLLRMELEGINYTIKKDSKKRKGRASAENTMDCNPERDRFVLYSAASKEFINGVF